MPEAVSMPATFHRLHSPSTYSEGRVPSAFFVSTPFLLGTAQPEGGDPCSPPELPVHLCRLPPPAFTAFTILSLFPPRRLILTCFLRLAPPVTARVSPVKFRSSFSHPFPRIIFHRVPGSFGRNVPTPFFQDLNRIFPPPFWKCKLRLKLPPREICIRVNERRVRSSCRCSFDSVRSFL